MPEFASSPRWLRAAASQLHCLGVPLKLLPVTARNNAENDVSTFTSRRRQPLRTE